MGAECVLLTITNQIKEKLASNLNENIYSAAMLSACFFDPISTD